MWLWDLHGGQKEKSYEGKIGDGCESDGADGFKVCDFDLSSFSSFCSSWFDGQLCLVFGPVQ
jgi:hypothetical protein